MKKNITLICINLLIVYIIFLFAEFGLNFLLNHPPKKPGPVLNALRIYYYFYDRKIIQMLPWSGRHDKALAYTLRPGKFVFENREFSTKYTVYSLGLRDNFKSQVSPPIIVLGDSYAMGWGVNQAETFAELLEEKLHVKVLNAGMSSFGTAREILLLDRIDTTQLRLLIIQYNDSDFYENEMFHSRNNIPPIMSWEQYHKTSQEHLSASKYYLGKHTFKLTPILFKSVFQPEKSIDMITFAGRKRDYDKEAEMFINALFSTKKTLDNVHIIVCEINDFQANNNSAFIEALKKNIQENDYPRFIERISFVDLSPSLDESHYFTLDEHINAKGHQVAADMIYNKIKRQQPGKQKTESPQNIQKKPAPSPRPVLPFGK